MSGCEATSHTHAHEIVSICLHISSHKKKKKTSLACAGQHTSELWHVTETQRMAKSVARWWITFSWGLWMRATLSEKKLLRLKTSTKEKKKKSAQVTHPEDTLEQIGSWGRNGLDLHRASSLTFCILSALVTHPSLLFKGFGVFPWILLHCCLILYSILRYCKQMSFIFKNELSSYSLLICNRSHMSIMREFGLPGALSLNLFFDTH